MQQMEPLDSQGVDLAVEEHGQELLLAFENEIALKTDSAFGVVMTGGIDAYFAIFSSFDFDSQSEIIIPPAAPKALLTALRKANLIARIVDVATMSNAYDLASLTSSLSEHTAGIYFSHDWGSINNVADIAEIASESGCAFIEEVSQGFGNSFQGTHFGAWGDISMVTFDRTTVLRSSTPLCVAVTNSHELQGALRDLGRGTAIGPVIDVASQIEALPSRIFARRILAARYAELLSATPAIELVADFDEPGVSPWLFPIRISGIELHDLFTDLADAGIEVSCYSPIVQAEPGVRDANELLHPNALDNAHSVIGLPCHEELTTQDVEEICHVIVGYIKREQSIADSRLS